jgi:hypothetical protein
MGINFKNKGGATMSDTPETDLEDDLYIECDDSCVQCYVIKGKTGKEFTGDFVPAEFARRLERERDELRQRLSAKISMGEICIASRKYIDGIEKERDEAQYLVKTLSAECDKLEADKEYNAQLARGFRSERDQLLAIIAERNELRQVIRYVYKAFPDLDEFQDKDGRSLKWLADKIQKAKGEA